MHSLAVSVKEGLPFVWNLPLENSQELTGFASLTVRLLFPLFITFFLFMYSF